MMKTFAIVDRANNAIKIPASIYASCFEALLNSEKKVKYEVLPHPRLVSVAKK